MTHPGPDQARLHQLWAALMEDSDRDPSTSLVTANDINRETASRFAPTQIAIERMLIRITGTKTAAHHVAVRTASKTLLSLQESLSAIGASMADRATRAGRIPEEILRATELHLTPRVLPGSVEFTLVRPEPETLFRGTEDELFDDSLAALVTFLSDLNRDDLDSSAIVSQLRSFGPRTAKHLFDLSEVLLEESVGVDLNWEDRQGTVSHASLGRRSAAYLKELALENSQKTTLETITGTLVTVSQVDRQALVLDDGSKIPLRADADLQPDLALLYGKRILATVELTVSVNLTTGKEKRVYHLQQVEADSPGTSDSVGLQDLD